MKRFIIMIVVVIGLALLWMAGWMFVAGQVRDEVAMLATADGVSAPRLVCDDLTVGGAPFSFSPHCKGAHLVSGDIAIDLADITGTALFYRPFHIQVFATGPAMVTDAFTGTAQEVRWSNLHASLRLNDGAIERFSAIADDLVYADTLMGETVIATADRGEVHLIDATPSESQPGAGRVYDAYSLFDGIDSAAYDISGGKITVDARLSGLPDPALWGDPQVLGFWQALGGELTLRELNASAEGLSLVATGEAKLSEAGLINASLDLASEGVAERIARLVGDPSIAQIGLGSPGEDGVARQRLTITNGNVVVGVIPIAAIPPLF
ncbi:MAG TPA: DUF2125 domain-containing protein [Pelagibacterium sp.]|uniref:DUF2125 domain-containing protein n=1 Tax=Pelagibacterium sp. TaxID=1967288 RepID=UPI002B5D3A23|nr:DUF2125 domain-containing protein [Pelagibacterium sp.]HWJ88473.1 DUF2125 domain-containing protein [Pelagibacterium sp.]